MRRAKMLDQHAAKRRKTGASTPVVLAQSKRLQDLRDKVKAKEAYSRASTVNGAPRKKPMSIAEQKAYKARMKTLNSMPLTGPRETVVHDDHLGCGVVTAAGVCELFAKAPTLRPAMSAHASEATGAASAGDACGSSDTAVLGSLVD